MIAASSRSNDSTSFDADASARVGEMKKQVSVLSYFAWVFVRSTTTCFKSSTNARIGCLRHSPSCARKKDDGWTVCDRKGFRRVFYQCDAFRAQEVSS
jgi:hypothetical protein